MNTRINLSALTFTVLTLGLLATIGCATTGASGRSTRDHAAGSIADPTFLEQYGATMRFSLGRPASIKPTPQGDAVLFLRSGPRSFVRDLYEFDVASGEERVLLTAAQILQGVEEQLTAEEKARRERMRLSARGIARYMLSEDGKRILVPLGGDLYVVERSTGAVSKLSSDAGYPIDPQFSHDATKISVVHDNDLYVLDISSGDETRLTTRDNDATANGVSEFVAQEEMGRFHGKWWSPDGSRLAYQFTDESEVEVLRIMDPTKPEKAPNEWRYPRPGKTNASVKLGTISAQGGETTWVQWDHAQYPYLATVKWSEHGPLTILVQNRTQTEEMLLAVDDETGYTTTLLVEGDNAWINLDQSMPHWLPDGRGFLWTTERNGAWQLEHRAVDGSLIGELTPVDFGFRRFVHYQAEVDEAIVSASAESTETHIWRVPLDMTRGGPRRRTTEPGSHSVSFAEKGFLHVHSYSTLDGKVGRDVLGRNGPKLGELTSVAEELPFDINMELTTVGDVRQYDAVIIRPRDFDSGKKYPVIVSVYGGPHAKMVSASPRRYALQQWFADHGFVVVQIDGRGTPNRGRAWERAIKNDLITIPLADQVEALAALGERYRELDLNHVGIYGWSFGGYFSAHAVLQRSDVFHAAVAGAPVTDWRDYDTHYTERYMGLPEENAAGYDRASALTYAEGLTSPLMIIHGTADDNVYFMHSLKLTDALFRAGKDFEFVPLAGFTHMVPEPLVTNRLYTRIIDFFVKNLQD